MADRNRTEATSRAGAKRVAPAAVVCAWCGVSIVRGHANGAVVSTSHGLCAPCARRLSRSARR
jgi:hypothetical protein